MRSAAVREWWKPHPGEKLVCLLGFHTQIRADLRQQDIDVGAALDVESQATRRAMSAKAPSVVSLNIAQYVARAFMLNEGDSGVTNGAAFALSKRQRTLTIEESRDVRREVSHRPILPA